MPGGLSFLEQDSAGVLLATTLGSQARTPIGWVVDTLFSYQIGKLEGEEPYLFSGIRSARQLSDGRVVVLDWESCELRFFGTDGVFLHLKGGTGEGPGEFHAARSCHLVPSPGNDALCAFDGRALLFFDGRGRFSHRLPVSWSGQPVTRVHGVAGERVLVERRYFPMMNENPNSPTYGLFHEPSTADFALFDLDAWVPVWERFLPGVHEYRTPSGVRYWLPFDILPDAVLGRDGLFLTLGEDRGPEILEYDMSGRLRRIIRLAEAVVAPSPGDIDKLVEFGLAPYDLPDTSREKFTDIQTRSYSEMPLPQILPVFSRLLVDEVGWLWAELHRFDIRQPVRWLVFGPTGEGLGSVDMPPDLEIWQIGRDFVLGVWEDELDVAYVRRHTLIGRG